MLLIAALVAGCGGSSDETQPLQDAQPFADAFVDRLVADGRWAAIEGDLSAQLRQPMRDFQATIRRNGVRRVRGPGALRHDCPPNEVVPEAGKDCFVYRLEGRQAVLVAGVRRLRARFRLWVEPQEGTWQVINYDYEVLPSMR
ncbi:MAG TPA: hypothetical protein VFT86_06065 [Gaiellaceae bacterium]|nr:hypothetical protein [Gaiellaceae bacterium]